MSLYQSFQESQSQANVQSAMFNTCLQRQDITVLIAATWAGLLGMIILMSSFALSLFALLAALLLGFIGAVILGTLMALFELFIEKISK